MKKMEQQLHKLLMQHRGSGIFSMTIEKYQKSPSKDYFEDLINCLKSQGEDNPKNMVAVVGRKLFNLINEYYDKILSQVY